MNDSQIDQLFQVLATRPDAGGVAPARSREDSFGFENHLRQASESSTSDVIDVPLPPLPTPPRYKPSENRQPADSTASKSHQTAPAAGESNKTSPRNESSKSDETSEEVATPLAAVAEPPSTGTSEPVRKANAEQSTGSKESPPPAVKGEHTKRAAITESAAAAKNDESTPATDNRNESVQPETDESSAEVTNTDKGNTVTASAVVADGEVQGEVVAVVQHQVAEQQLPINDPSASSPRIRAKSVKSPTNDAHREQPSVATTKPPEELGEKVTQSPTTDAKVSVSAPDSPKQATNQPAKKPQVSGEKTDATEEDPSPDQPRGANSNRATAAATTAIVAATVATDGTTAAIADSGETSAGPKKVVEAKPSLLTSAGRLDRAGTTGTRSGKRTGDSQLTPNVDPARFVSRVAKAITTAQERGGPLQLRLSPPELGAMRLELAVKEGVLTARIQTDNTHARQVLLDNLPALRERLGEQNIRIERFDVDVRRDSSEQPNAGTQQRQPREHSQTPQNRPDAPRRPVVDEPLPGPQPMNPTITSATINLVA